MATITKKEIIDQIANNTRLKQVVVRNVVQDFLDEIINDLAKDNRLEFRDFGVFEVRNHPPRIAQNPKTLEPVQVEARRTVKFKAGRLMKQKLNNKAFHHPPPKPDST